MCVFNSVNKRHSGALVYLLFPLNYLFFFSFSSSRLRIKEVSALRNQCVIIFQQNMEAGGMKGEKRWEKKASGKCQSFSREVQRGW